MAAYRKGLKRKPKIAYTEWNCADTSHRAMSPGWRPTTSQYRLVDALACAGFINAMQRQCNTVTLANFAQTLNVVGMLVVTPEAVLRETVFWTLTLQRRHSGNVAVDAWTACDAYQVDNGRGELLDAPYLDVSATLNDATGRQFVSIVNTHRTETIETTVKLGGGRTGRTYTLAHADPFAKNTFEAPETIKPQLADVAVSEGSVTMVLQPHSYTILEVDP
jgi:alpha-N-arabinofuranosidase